MTNHAKANPRALGKLLATMAALSVLIAPGLRAQSTPTQAQAQSAATPQWQIAAGGSRTFDDSSVNLGAAGEPEKTNFPLGLGDVYAPTGGVFTAKNVLLIEYLLFAYKLAVTPSQVQAVRSQLPGWANTNRYDIEGRVSGNPTKDQFRLMMQALLADRFKLALHFETRQSSVYALIVDTPGKLGPKLRPHRDKPPCPAVPPSTARNTFTGDFPTACGGIIAERVSDLVQRFGGRNVTMAQVAGSLGEAVASDLGRPVVDQTNLSGNFDFSIEFTPGLNDMQPGFEAPESEIPFPQALKQQLGLKLEPEKGPVDFLFVDHVERPSPN